MSAPVADPLTPFLAVAVPQEIARLQAKGGPDEADFAANRRRAERLACEGDVLLYGGGRKGQAAELLRVLTEALAVLSFRPGGVACFGLRFASTAPPQAAGR